VEELRPTTPMQQVLVSQLAHLTWQLDQIPKLEPHLLAATSDTPSGDPTPSTQDYTNHLTALHLLENQPTPLTRLWDHHRRLLTRTQSLLRQLLQLQKHERTRADEDPSNPNSPTPSAPTASTPPNSPPATKPSAPATPPPTHPPKPAKTCHNLPKPATPPRRKTNPNSERRLTSVAES